MATNFLDDPIFHDADKARERLEALIWPHGPYCPHCGDFNATQLQGKAHRPGLYQCNGCREQYTVTVKTLFERSKVPLNKWLMALYLLMACKKGISAHQMSRMIGVSYKSTWFVMHRLREALRDGKFPGPIGGEGKTVEIDETFVGGKQKNKHRSKRDKLGTGGVAMEPVFSLVERGGHVRSHHVASVNAATLRPILLEQVHQASTIMTDENKVSKGMAKAFAATESVHHGAGEYVRGGAHTNTIENYFSILKRGITGTYHHVSATHLKRYLAEFDFRYNQRMGLGVSDMERMEKAAQGIAGKRLTYRRTSERPEGV